MKRVLLVCAMVCWGNAATAAPRPSLSADAASLLTKGGLFLVPEDNLAVPLPGTDAAAAGKPTARARSVAFLVEKPRRLEIVTVGPGEAVLAIDEDLYRLKGTTLTRIATDIGIQPALSKDGQLVASVVERKQLRLTSPRDVRTLRHLHSGRWELERPYVTPDSTQVLVALRDYTLPLDVYSFVLVNSKTLETEELEISQNFIPGSLRQPLGPTQVGILMHSQSTDENGFAKLGEGSILVFDFKTKKFSPAPAGLRPGHVSPSGKRSLLQGAMRYSDDKTCGGDETLLYDVGAGKPVHFAVAADSVVSLLDFLPGEGGLVANILDLKTCSNRGAIIFLDQDLPPAKWPPFALPVRGGRVTGRVLQTVQP